MTDLFFSEYIQSGTSNQALEIYNSNESTVDLSSAGYAIEIYADGSTSPTTTINLTGTIAAGKTFVVTDKSADAIILDKGNQTNTELSFNGNDAIVLRKASNVIDAIGQVGFDPGTAWTNGDISTQDTNLRRKTSVIAGSTNPQQTFNPSLEWDAYAATNVSNLGTHTTLGRESQRIYDIQGKNHRSPLENQLLSTVPGIVTAIQQNTATVTGEENGGFYIQDPSGDGNTATSDGIFIFTGSTPSLKSGDSVIVTGIVREIRPNNDPQNLTVTQIVTPSYTTVSTGNPLPAPTVIGNGGRIPPTTTIKSAVGNIETSAELFNPNSEGMDFYESLEGMLVQVNNAVAVSPSNSEGEIWILGDNGANATGRTPRGGISIISSGTNVDYNPERIEVDNTLFKGTNTSLTNPDVNVAAQLGTISGIIDYRDRNYELLNTSDLNPSAKPLQPSPITRETTALKGSDSQLTVATFNASNLDPSSEKLVSRLANIIANNLQAPDIIALQDVSDNSGQKDDGIVDAKDTYQALIDAIATAGGGTYDYQQINPTNNQDGGPLNNRSGFLFNPSRVTFVAGTAGSADNAIEVNSGTTVSLNPGRIDPTNSAFNNQSKSLAGLFEFNNEKFFVVNNDFISQAEDEPLFSPNQPPARLSEAKRIEQAATVNNFVDGILATDANANIIVLGSFNDFPTSEALNVLKGQPEGEGTAVLTNLVENINIPADRYTAIIDGNSQPLDQILISKNLRDKTAPEIDIVHSNVEFTEPEIDNFILREPVLSRFSFGTNITLTISPSAFPDIVPAGTLRGKVTRTGNIVNPVDVTVTVSDPLEANFNGVATKELTISAGQSTVEFNIDAVNDQIIDTTWKTVDLTAAATGYTDGKTKVTVIDDITAAIPVLPSESPAPIPSASPTPVNNTPSNTTRPDDPILTPLTFDGSSSFIFNYPTDNATFTTSIGDTLTGNDGNDILIGGGGDDCLVGYQGDDILDATSGNDTLFGGKDRDTLLGGGDSDLVWGEEGADILDGGVDGDTLFGGTENDTLYGNSGNDSVYGNEGDDLIYGNDGNDSLFGNQGSDTISGWEGEDSIFAGKGSDFVFAGEGGDFVCGDLGDDYLSGEAGNDELCGREGADTLYGGIGADTLEGGADNDTLVGGAGADQLQGGEGRDVFIFSDLSDNGDTILDFAAGDDGDVLNLQSVFNKLNYAGSNPINDKFLRLVQVGSDAELQIDSDGASAQNDFTVLVTLKNITAGSFNASNYTF
ncbi:lamin tail domain-containing protein [Kamptonema sp. UHCC 0994]|uniref:lamin tail domain-containing protein n=1 Tax=Kamptonema sp. UHCC 0994 TaxID=3031329 RepID=UPI0023B989A0|nr:lamin tail domain-containing protein [Kamptonema sp. UHCC 0994]MDF0552861.1 lamin tail domain-containing protein [Kamptonema sp. UHCC 0994]